MISTFLKPPRSCICSSGALRPRTCRDGRAFVCRSMPKYYVRQMTPCLPVELWPPQRWTLVVLLLANLLFRRQPAALLIASRQYQILSSRLKIIHPQLKSLLPLMNIWHVSQEKIFERLLEISTELSFSFLGQFIPRFQNL